MGVLTLAALLLRLNGFHQGLALDETLTFDEIHGHALSDLVSQMRAHGEDNPPLYYVLAWLGAQTGDDTVSIRLPSLILGSATVPLIFLLGRRTVGRAAGALAAAFVAISPFAIFYSAEARGYASAIFFSALSTLTLLRALEARNRWWWVAYAGSAAALLYTHYVGGFVIVAQAAWVLVFRRSRWKPALLASAAAAISFIPWAATAKGGRFETVVGGPLHPTFRTLEPLLAVFPGQPFSQILRPTLEQFPGVTALALVATGVAAAVAGALAFGPRTDPDMPDSTRPDAVVLLAMLTLASPAGVFAYAVAKHDIFLSRYFSPSLPALLLLVAWLLLRPRPAIRLAAVGLVLAGLLIGTAKSFEHRFQRPPLDDMAGFIRAHTRPGDAVVENPLPKLAFYTQPLHAYLGTTRSFSLDPRAESAVWKRAGTRGRVAILTADLNILPYAPARWGPGLCFKRVARRAFRGAIQPGVAIFGLGRGGADCLRLAPAFGDGFGPHEEFLSQQWNSLVERQGQIAITNTGRAPRTVLLTMSLDRPGGRPARIGIRYPDGATQSVDVTARPTQTRRELRLAPGRNTITMTAHAQAAATPQGAIYLRVVNARVS